MSGQMSDTSDMETNAKNLLGHKIETRKIVTHTAYARNGNAHNPTQYCAWLLIIDGKIRLQARKRKDALSAVPAILAEMAEQQAVTGGSV